jgi:hypothetical protein
MSDKQKTDVVYALADYKQLVLAYRTKYTELVKSVAFWRASVIWLSAFVCLLVGLLATGFLAYRADLLRTRTQESSLTRDVERLSGQLRNTQQVLEETRSDLEKKEGLIQELEKNISTASKKTLEKMLKETE